MSTSPSPSSIRSPPLELSRPQLPVELLRQIIEYSVPSYYHSLTYQTRQLTLRNLCLTSRLFRKIARPILERIEHLRLSNEGGSTEQNMSVRSSRVHVLAVCVDVEMPLETINPLLLSYAQLKELHITSVGRIVPIFDVSLLGALPFLDSLTINRARLTFTTPCPLLTLKHLTLTRCSGDLDALFAQPSFLPSLKVLALLYSQDAYDPVYNNHVSPRVELFIGNLDLLREEVSDEHGDKILSAYRYHDCIFPYLNCPNLHHLRLNVTSVDLETAGEVEELCGTLNTIRNYSSKNPLETLFLDKGLRDALHPFRFTQVTYDALIKVCEENGTEVVLEEQAGLDSPDSPITPELLRWMDRRKEKARLSLEGGI